ncbi:MAG: hypothetical protein IJY62_01445 [Clostridia bacterium]|nr:hypothetical protein [Clostridia bacterium]
MREPIFDPLEFYLREGKARHERNVAERFSEFSARASIDEAENERTVHSLQIKKKEAEAVARKAQGVKRARRFGILGIIAAFFIAVFALNKASMSSAAFSACVFLSLAASIFLIVFLCVKLRKRLKNVSEQYARIRGEADELETKAFEQVASLNVQFTDEDSLRLIEKSLPCVSFDGFFTEARLKELVGEYGYNSGRSDDTCVIGTLSGELYSRPFLYERRLTHRMGWQTYHGSRSISWEERTTDSEGKTVYTTRTQTLTASVTKPKPYYRTSTRLSYGHEALEELRFSRTYAHAEDESERALEKKLKKGARKLRELEEKALKEGKDFVGLVNTEFEVLFGATNRSDERLFRIMFTMQAQENMLKLLLSDDGYGDDFNFFKQGKINVIESEHSAARSFGLPAAEYYSCDHREIRRNFIGKNEAFFKAVFFDFAPLLLIPVYQQPLARNTVHMGGSLCDYNFEEIAQRLSSRLCPESETEVIVKTSLIERTAGFDRVRVFASGYTTCRQVDYVSVRGGDGDYHDVEVYWTEYVPFTREEILRISKGGASGTHYHGYSVEIE